MGCGETLGTTTGGSIMCVAPHCERPTALAELLQLRDVIEHRVTLEATRFQVVHPLRERFGVLLAGCPLDEHLKSLTRPPESPGVYLAEQQSDGRWVYTPWGGR